MATFKFIEATAENVKALQTALNGIDNCSAARTLRHEEVAHV